jgi:hypothetical protein
MQLKRPNPSTKKPHFLSLSIVGGALLAAACDGAPGAGADDDATNAFQTAQAREALLASPTEDTAGAERAAPDCPRDNKGTPSSATVDVWSNRGRLSPIAVGANAAAWDGHLVDPELPALLEGAGLQVLRYPGGSTSDNYHWLSNTPDDPAQGGTTPSANFDAYMSVVKAVRAQAMLTVNYGSGTAQEAADWVRYANRGGPHYSGPVPTYSGASSTGHNYGITYWEVGNEVYGDGTYGATWEVNHKSHDPTTYAQGVVSYSAAMKAVDPSIKLGMVLTAPGNWPDGQTSATSPQPWNDTVLPIACSSVDFVVLHWYAQGPTAESDAALLASPELGESTPVSYTPDIPTMVATAKSAIGKYCGAHAAAVQIMVTETNSVSYNPGKQTTSLVNALFLADQVTTWLENGVTNVDWWAVHNSPVDGNIDAALYGSYNFGDYGILSAGMTSASGAAEPAANTPFPSYYGLQMLSHLYESAGGTILTAASSNSLVSIHAVRQRDGSVNVMLINKDPSVTYSVKVSLPRTFLYGVATVMSYGMNSSAITASKKAVMGNSVTLAAGPYSLTTIKLP